MVKIITRAVFLPPFFFAFYPRLLPEVLK